MHGRAVFLGLCAIAASACSHAGTARGAVTCTLAGPSGTAIDAGACATVAGRVRAGTDAAMLPDTAIELDLSRAGSAVARLSGRPDIAVDVMDRALRDDDLTRLGDAIAAAIRHTSPPVPAP